MHQRRLDIAFVRVFLALLIAVAAGIPDFRGLPGSFSGQIHAVSASGSQQHGIIVGSAAILNIAEQFEEEIEGGHPPLIVPTSDLPHDIATVSLTAPEWLLRSRLARAHLATGPPSL